MISRISHYRIVRELGEGGMGRVYLAEDEQLNRYVALKVLPAESTKDLERMARFRQEALATSALNHPSILTVYETGESDGTHFIATEYVEGETLRQRIHRGGMKLEEILDIAIAVAGALVAANDVGIIHRDIKPENIMIRKDGIAKVLDFGLAKLVEKRRDGHDVDTERKTEKYRTTPGNIMGTIHYMSPEQILGLEIDERSDLFSLGIILYEMIAGFSPFDHPSRGEIIGAILGDEAPELPRSVAPRGLDAIVARALAKDRDNRYQTASELLDDLRAVRTDVTVARRRSDPDSPSSWPSYPAPGIPRQSARTSRTKTSVFGLVATARRHKLGAAIAAILVVVSFAAIAYIGRQPRHISSIAILPFVNVDGGADAEYLSEGLTDTVTERLAQLSGLTVMARSTVYQYKTKQYDPRSVGRDLGVDAVVVGRTERRGDDLIVAVEMVDVRTGAQLWGDTYRRSIHDLYLVQEEIARDISYRLRLRLSGRERERLTRRDTMIPEAYDQYLQGRYLFNKWAHQRTTEALAHFQRATRLDPRFGLAWAGIADCYNMMGSYTQLAPAEAFPKAREAAEKALSIDDGLAEAHLALAYELQNYEWKWGRADREYQRAIELNPNDATAHHWYGGFLLLMGQFDEAIRQRDIAHRLDPLSIVITTGLGTPYLHARRYNEAILEYLRAVRLDPQHAQAHLSLAWAYLDKGGMTDEAISEIEKAMRLSHQDPRTSTELAYAYAQAGRRDEAIGIIDNLRKSGRYVSPYDVGIVYAELGEKNTAIAWLEKAYEEHSNRLTSIRVDPAVDPLRDDPRFAALLSEMHLQQQPEALTATLGER